MKTINDLIQAFAEFRAGFADSQKAVADRDKALADKAELEKALADEKAARAQAETNLKAEQDAHTKTKGELAEAVKERDSVKAQIADPQGAAAKAVAAVAAAAAVPMNALPNGGAAGDQSSVANIKAKIKAAKTSRERLELMVAHYDELTKAGVKPGEI